MMAVVFIIFCFVITNIDAATDNKKRENVKHLRGALLYAGACLIPFFALNGLFHWWHFVFMPLLTRAALFDILLNSKMGEGWLYEGDMTKDKSKFSIIDRIEKWTGLSVFFLRIFYLAVYAGYLIYFLIDEL